MPTSEHKFIVISSNDRAYDRLISRIKGPRPLYDFTETLRTDHETISYKAGEKDITALLWRSAESKFSKAASEYSKRCNAVVLLADLNDPKTLEAAIASWKEITTVAHSKIFVIPTVNPSEASMSVEALADLLPKDFTICPIVSTKSEATVTLIRAETLISISSIILSYEAEKEAALAPTSAQMLYNLRAQSAQMARTFFDAGIVLDRASSESSVSPEPAGL